MKNENEVGEYRKKPVVIKAVRWNGENIDEVAKLGGGKRLVLWDGTKEGELIIKTLEGNHECKIGSWVIEGVEGEIYPCRHDIFLKTYESADLLECVIVKDGDCVKCFKTFDVLDIHGLCDGCRKTILDEWVGKRCGNCKFIDYDADPRYCTMNALEHDENDVCGSWEEWDEKEMGKFLNMTYHEFVDMQRKGVYDFIKSNKEFRDFFGLKIPPEE